MRQAFPAQGRGGKFEQYFNNIENYKRVCKPSCWVKRDKKEKVEQGE